MTSVSVCPSLSVLARARVCVCVCVFVCVCVDLYACETLFGTCLLLCILYDFCAQTERL